MLRAWVSGVCVNCVKRVIPRLTEVVTTRNKNGLLNLQPMLIRYE